MPVSAADPGRRPSPIRRCRSRRSAGVDRRAPPVHRGSRQARRADPRPAGSVQRAVLLPVAGSALVRHRRAGARADDRARWPATRRNTRWRWSCPVYEREQAGVYYNTAAVYDADGTYLGQVPQEPHPAHQRLLGEVLLQAGQSRLPGVQDALRDDRRLHLLRPSFP